MLLLCLIVMCGCCSLGVVLLLSVWLVVKMFVLLFVIDGAVYCLC